MNNLRTFPFRFHVGGQAACFRRPEFVEDFISYDVMPPFVAKRMLNALYRPDGVEWMISYIEVLNPIRFKPDRISGARRERRAVVLDEVAYVIAADLRADPAADVDHHALLNAAVFHNSTIHLGLASFPGTIRLLKEDEHTEALLTPVMHDLGWMLLEIRNDQTKLPTFFRAQLRNGRVSFSEDLLIAI